MPKTTTSSAPNNAAVDITAVEQYLLQWQQRIEDDILRLDGGTVEFVHDNWHRESACGSAKIIAEGEVIEKGGVNYSSVSGQKLPSTASERYPDLAQQPFRVLGVSVVMHPRNPYCPTSHANLRFFLVGDNHWWFGGGYDLTPYYGFAEDCRHWHSTAQEACAPFAPDLYPRLKKWCDQYFYLPHRREPRGIGGIFFDDFNEWDWSRCFDFWKKVGDSYLAAYVPILQRRRNMAYGQRERDFQLYRRGRYVEFNLLHDRGTRFGLQSQGRIESILMSLPPLARWQYNWCPEDGSPESQLYSHFLPPRNWLTDV